MSQVLMTRHPYGEIPSFDAVVAHQLEVHTSFTEAEALKSTHWDLGEDAHLREDLRFRPTPWGRWILSSTLLANDAVYLAFGHSERSEMGLDEALTEVEELEGRHASFCTGDPRFVVQGKTVRLAASELGDQPLFESPMDLEKYLTHLPVHTLEAVAASEPAGEWGPGAREQFVETLGWVRVDVPGRRLNDRMFVARVTGRSMDSWKKEYGSSGYAVFELWPAGTKQNQIVVVRGAFDDPEMGSFAIKKYAGDVRDEEGRHRRITLVSLNPDKERYPDIVLEPEQDEDLEVVARLVDVLSPGQFGRQPRKKRRKGRRDFTSTAGRERIEKRLERAAQRFFEGAHAGRDTSEEETKASWSARLICLDEAGGGLHVEAGPLAGLPSFAKKLAVRWGDSAPRIVLASNFRSRLWRVPVAPSGRAYRWTAPGREDLLDEDLAVLELPGLPPHLATLFKPDASGVGRPMAGGVLSPGYDYRVLIPPGLADVELQGGEVQALGDGWRLWETTVPANPSPEYLAALDKTGLQLGKTCPRVRWTIVSPVAYRTAPSGEAYPCFAAGDTPVLTVTGAPVLREGEMTGFLHGRGRTARLPLSRSDAWTVELGGLEPGNYVFQVLHARTAFLPVRMPFAVIDEIPAPVSVTLRVSLCGEVQEVAGDGRLELDEDLSCLGEEPTVLEIEGPPLWQHEVRWETEARSRVGRFHLEPDGSLDGDRIARQTEHHRSRAKLADLILDFDELGSVTVRHHRRSEPSQVRNELAALVDQRGASVEALRGQFRQLRNIWLEPVLDHLQYQLRDLEEEDLRAAPTGTTALLLLETRRDGARIVVEPYHVLVLVQTPGDLERGGPGTAKEFADELCQRHDVRRAILTDGLHWTLHNRGGRAHAKVWDLRQIVQAPDELDFEDFLSQYAVGV